MAYKPPAEQKILEPYQPPNIRKHVPLEATEHEIDMYSWLLEKLVKKCHSAGVDDASSVVGVMAEIFKVSPQRTEDVTRDLVEHLRQEADFDLISFLNCFTDEETLKRRFGDELYNSLFRVTSKRRSPSPDIRSFTSDFSSLPSPSKVNYPLVSGAGKSHLPHLPSRASSSTTGEAKTQSTSYSSLSVASALKLKWDPRRTASASAGTTLTVTPRTTTPKRHSEVVVSTSYLSEQRTLLSSAATKMSLTIPSESSSFTFTPSEESMTASVGRKLEALRSALRKHSLFSPKRRRRPSSVTFASSIAETEEGKRASSAEPFEGDYEGPTSGEPFEGAYEGPTSAEPFEGAKGTTGDEEDRSKPTEPPVDFITTLLESTGVLKEADHLLKELLLKPWFPLSYKKGKDRRSMINNIFNGLCK